MQLQNWIGSKLSLALAEKLLGELDKLNYLDSFISPGFVISNGAAPLAGVSTFYQ